MVRDRKSSTQVAPARWVLAGSIASVVSTLVLTACGWRENRRPAGPSNGPSQWVWGREAANRRTFSVPHTVVGYAIHHLSSLFWARVHEMRFRRSWPVPLQQELLRGLSTAALACAVDYRAVPRRLQPGFEQQLSRTSLFAVYTVFGLAIGATRYFLIRHGGQRRG
jgi:hypothetical protein